ncbi:MAG: hypothetical protein DWI25_03545 [Planctomycetota bacterium]|nr:MAG: hypothetical protein DWI25_03545 [Planctomycetota bacterium]
MSLGRQSRLRPIQPHHLQNSSASGSIVANETGVYWLWATQDNLRAEAFSHVGQRLWHASPDREKQPIQRRSSCLVTACRRLCLPAHRMASPGLIRPAERECR